MVLLWRTAPFVRKLRSALLPMKRNQATNCDQPVHSRHTTQLLDLRARLACFNNAMNCSSVNRDVFIDASNSPRAGELCAIRWIRIRVSGQETAASSRWRCYRRGFVLIGERPRHSWPTSSISPRGHCTRSLSNRAWFNNEEQNSAKAGSVLPPQRQSSNS